MAAQQQNDLTLKDSNDKEKTLWLKCPSCDQIIYKKDLTENFKICPKCNYYIRMNAMERIEMLVEKKENGSLQFQEIDAGLSSQDPLQFHDHAVSSHHDSSGKHPAKRKSPYLTKVSSEQKKTGHLDAVVCGEAIIGKHKVILSVMNFDFMGGSMGSVVGEKVTRAIERALELKIPFIMVSASGGARMQEGVLSLMQLAKTSAAVARLHESSILFVSILCDPTTGGVTASYSMLGDILIAEPKALIAFAGPRVIEQTIHQKLPGGFQQSEFLLKHGMIDCIVERKNLKTELIKFLDFFGSSTDLLNNKPN